MAVDEGCPDLFVGGKDPTGAARRRDRRPIVRSSIFGEMHQLDHVLLTRLRLSRRIADLDQQFTDVSGPAPEHAGLDERRLSHQVRGELTQLPVDQKWDVLGSLPQRRQRDPRSAETEEEVLTKGLVRDSLPEVLVRRGAEVDVDRDRPRGAEWKDLPCFEDSEKLRLDGQVEFANLVEEECATIGLLNRPLGIPIRAREGSLFRAEEQSLCQPFRNRCAVDGDEASLATWSELVKGARDDFLATAGFSVDVKNPSLCGTSDGLQNTRHFHADDAAIALFDTLLQEGTDVVEQQKNGLSDADRPQVLSLDTACDELAVGVGSVSARVIDDPPLVGFSMNARMATGHAAVAEFDAFESSAPQDEFSSFGKGQGAAHGLPRGKDQEDSGKSRRFAFVMRKGSLVGRFGESLGHNWAPEW